jgi:hypothetical protein
VSDCILWTKCCFSNGYGAVKVKGKQWRAHRYVWTQAHGEIPNGLWVLHRCDNHPCVNLDHLFLGTPQINWDDCRAKGRDRHLRGADAGQAKLSEDQIIAIRNSTESCTVLSKRFGVCRMQISRIKRGVRWEWL